MWILHFQKKNQHIKNASSYSLNYWVCYVLKLIGFVHVGPPLSKTQQIKHSNILLLNVLNYCVSFSVRNWLELYMWSLHFQKSDNSKNHKLNYWNFELLNYGFLWVLEIAWICTCRRSIFKNSIIQKVENKSSIETFNYWIIELLKIQQFNNSIIH